MYHFPPLLAILLTSMTIT